MLLDLFHGSGLGVSLMVTVGILKSSREGVSPLFLALRDLV
jgi:hypothetical protein